MSEGSHLRGLLGGSSEAVEDTAYLSRIVPEHIERILPCIPLMDHDIEAEFSGEIELHAECVSLCGLPCSLRDQLSLLIGATTLIGKAECIDGSGRPPELLGNMMVIDPGFTDRHDLRVAGQLGQGGEEIESFLGDIGWMDADDRKEIRKPLGQRHGAAAAFQTGTDRDDPGDAGLQGTRDHTFKIRSKIGVIEMGVRLDQFHA